MKAIREDLLQTATQKLVAEFQPEQIWLFGSHAWGDPHDDRCGFVCTPSE